MAITRVSASNLSGTSLPSTITSASGLPLGKVLQIQKDEHVGSTTNSGSTFSDVQTVTVTPVGQNSKYLVRLSGGYIYNIND